MDQKQRFDENMEGMIARQGKHVKMFSDLNNQLINERLKEVTMPWHKWAPQGYALVT